MIRMFLLGFLTLIFCRVDVYLVSGQVASGGSGQQLSEATSGGWGGRSTQAKIIRKEQPPPFHFAVWDENGKICILAKFDASFTITYDTKYGKQQMIDRLVPDATISGRCESFLDEDPVMDVKWRGGFTFRLIFRKVTM